METTDIKFHEITLADKAWMDTKFAEDDRNACEYTFANNFIWRKVYQVEVAEVCDCLVIRFVENGQHCYSYPVGAGDKKAAVEKLACACKQKNQPFIMSPLSEADRKELIEWFPGRFLIFSDRDDFDYIYDREKLETLSGKKLHGKRNHIARFKDGGDWSYEPMTEENLEECRTMTYTWIKMRWEKWNDEMEQEIAVLHEAFDHMTELGLVGGVLRQEGKIVAFSMGEPQNTDTFVVHFEKAYPDMQGAYPMINQQFVLHECGEYHYINREDDTGDLGLRKAKMSYYPDILLKKYVAVESDVVYADPEEDREQIKKIWETCFGDDEEYIQFYVENRMTDENMLVIYEDGKAVSMASFLPVRYLCEGEYVDAQYVYAVATLPEYRGRGLAGRILTFAKEHYDEPLILAPAGESLIRYYEKLGFKTAFSGVGAQADNFITALAVDEEEEMPYELYPLSAEEYKKLRDEKCSCEGYVQWDEDAISYVIKLCEHYGGKCVGVKSEGLADAPTDILMYQPEEENLIILETSLSEEKVQELLPALFAETGTSRVVYGRMPGMIWLPQGMVDAVIPVNGYLGLTLG